MTQQATFQIKGMRHLTQMGLEVERDGESYACLGVTADPHWRYVDAAGHEHHVKSGRYPTLVRVLDETEWVENFDEESVEAVVKTHYICPQCAEVIKPGTIPPGTVIFNPGPMSATLHLEGIVHGQTRTVTIVLLGEHQVKAIMGPGGKEWAEALLLDPPENQMVEMIHHG